MGETVQDTGRAPDSVPWEMMVNTVIEEVGREGALINRARHPVERERGAIGSKLFTFFGCRSALGLLRG